MTKIFAVLAAVVSLLLTRCGPPEPVTVDTPLGKVRGIVSNGVHQFLGIKYAQAPDGNLRWKPPI